MKHSVNGVELSCRVDGRPDGEWLLASHALALGLGMWDGQVEALGRRFRVLRYDTRGHGDSGATPPPYSLDMLVDDALGLMDRLDIGRAHVLGISLGGLTGLGMAVAAPDRLLSLVACCCRVDAAPGADAAWDERAALARESGMAALVEPTLARWFTADFLTARPPVLERLGAMIRATSADGYAGCVEALRTLSIRGRPLADGLADITARTLVVAAAQDAGSPPSAVRAVQQAIAGAEYRELDRCGHLANIEQPDGFARILDEFYGPPPA